ncbi:MAG: CRISPR-associated endonuclease Cas1, partial [Bacteroidota bacterium]
MQLVLDSTGITLSKKGQLFIVFRDAEKVKTIAPSKLKSIAITAKVIIHSDAVILAIQHQIPILFFNPIGKMKARLWSPYFESLATLRRQQVHFAESPDATSWIIDLFQLKTEGQIQHLKFLKQRLKGMQLGIGQTIQRIRKQAYGFENYRDALIAESRQGLMGVEGTIARMYWQELGGSLPSAYRFRQRSRKPAKDIYNAGLNYLYGMLYSVVEGGLFAAGLDPQLG